MTVDAGKERNHYFDLLKYLLFIFVVLIHNPFLCCSDNHTPIRGEQQATLI